MEYDKNTDCIQSTCCSMQPWSDYKMSFTLKMHRDHGTLNETWSLSMKHFGETSRPQNSLKTSNVLQHAVMFRVNTFSMFKINRNHGDATKSSLKMKQNHIS